MLRPASSAETRSFEPHFEHGKRSSSTGGGGGDGAGAGSSTTSKVGTWALFLHFGQVIVRPRSAESTPSFAAHPGHEKLMRSMSDSRSGVVGQAGRPVPQQRPRVTLPPSAAGSGPGTSSA